METWPTESKLFAMAVPDTCEHQHMLQSAEVGRIPVSKVHAARFVSSCSRTFQIAGMLQDLTLQGVQLQQLWGLLYTLLQHLKGIACIENIRYKS